jgi:hypothetical protein
MRRTVAALWVAISAGLAGTASAQDVLPLGEEKVKLMLGAFLPAFDTDVRLDGEGMRGDNVSLGDDLGVERDDSGGWVGVEWRFAPRHRVGFTPSRFTRQGERDIDRTLTIGDETYPAGARVSTTSRLEILPITYSYSVLKRPHDELSLTAGLHWSRISLDLRGSVSLGTQDLSNSVSSEADVPLPLIGARYDRRFAQRWTAGAGVGVFSLSFAEDTFEMEGELWTARAYVEYHFARNWSVGAALDAFRLDIEASQDEWQGGLDYRYVGPQLYLAARF